MQAVKIDPKMGDAHLGLAVGFYNLKKFCLAFQHLQMAKQLGAEIDESLARTIENSL